jgi:hypothetical protein
MLSVEILGFFSRVINPISVKSLIYFLILGLPTSAWKSSIAAPATYLLPESYILAIEAEINLQSI